MHDQYTERVQQCNILDTTVHESLGWTAHTDTIVINISRTIYIFNKLKHPLLACVLMIMYISLIVTHFSYSISLWGFHLNIISKIQKKTIRIMFTGIYNSHTDQIILTKLVNVDDIFPEIYVMFYHRFFNNSVLFYFKT